ncbi:ARID DNA-binding domain-containing protein [Tanacetum coccineum]|uniref:ARID DNA-binding domain-containing protein n=1 Tax=Tanacetum coccineum TaxID=301880 RepID=A0ABQ4WGY3_9ASTR
MNWRFARQDKSNLLQWYQSQWFKPWEKTTRNHSDDFAIRYSLKNGTAEIVPKSNRKRQLSDESKIMLKEKLKEIEAFNTSKLCAAFKRLNTKNATRKEKRARCFICKKRGHVLWKCPGQEEQHKGETSKATDDEELMYPSVHRQDVLGELPPVIGVIKVDLLGLYKFVDNLGGYMNVEFNNQWSEIAILLGLTQEDRDAIKEYYKEYIGMVKVYYEEAKRSRQVRPGIVVGLEAPQAFARTSAIVEDHEWTKMGSHKVDVKTEESNADWAYTTTDISDEF